MVLVGRYFARGTLDASPDEQAKRRYRLSWVVTPAILVQAGLLWSIMVHWGERMATPAWLFTQMESLANLLTDVIGRPATGAVLSILGMVVVVLYYSLYSRPWLRLDRIAKRAQGSSVRNTQIKLTLRSTLAGFLPPQCGAGSMR